MYQIDFNKPIHVYFCGIGGISMSGLAQILKSRGFRVEGSDRSESAIVQQLKESGIPIHIGQRRENITKDIDLVIFTSAIHPDNPEYQQTMELGLPYLTRAQLLGEIMRNYDQPVAVSGTHGKTTTTSMLSEILLADKMDPTLSIGGILPSIGGQYRVGHNTHSFVAEACEYTNSFLSLYPKIGIILDIDADHLDFFKDIQDIRRSFRRFAELIPADGTLIINSDIDNVHEITDGLPCRVIYYGSDRDRSDYYPVNIRYDEYAHPTYTACNHTDKGGHTQLITLKVPGEHNVYNSLAAIAAADVLGVPRNVTGEALAGFEGTDRRFEYRGTLKNGAVIIDDYAHHPTEISATLSAAERMPHDRIVCIFQPHTYTRTKALLPQFCRALLAADIVILADIYAARETDTLGISSRTVADGIRELGGTAYYYPTFEEIKNFVRKNCRKGDVVITMGAGNVTDIGTSLVAEDR